MIAIRLLTAVIIFMTTVIVWGLINTRDGQLRKILISFFFIEMVVWVSVLVVAIWVNFDIKVQYIAWAVLSLKLFTKMKLFFYLTQKRRGDNLQADQKN